MILKGKQWNPSIKGTDDATDRARVSDSRLVQVIGLAKSVGATDELAYVEECMHFEDVSRLHLLYVEIFASEEGCSWKMEIAQRSVQLLLQIPSRAQLSELVRDLLMVYRYLLSNDEKWNNNLLMKK